MTSAYDEYRLSAAWRTRVAIMHEIAEGRCEVCGKDWDLHVHHLTYRDIGQEEPTDLVVLCRQCHRAVHGRSDAPATGSDQLIEIASRHPRSFAEYVASSVRRDFWQHYEDTGDDRFIRSVLE